jgi:hypothetical protein
VSRPTGQTRRERRHGGLVHPPTVGQGAVSIASPILQAFFYNFFTYKFYINLKIPRMNNFIITANVPKADVWQPQRPSSYPASFAT